MPVTGPRGQDRNAALRASTSTPAAQRTGDVPFGTNCHVPAYQLPASVAFHARLPAASCIACARKQIECRTAPQHLLECIESILMHWLPAA